MTYAQRQKEIRYYQKNIEAARQRAEQADLDAAFFRGAATHWENLLKKFKERNPK